MKGAHQNSIHAKIFINYYFPRTLPYPCPNPHSQIKCICIVSKFRVLYGWCGIFCMDCSFTCYTCYTLWLLWHVLLLCFILKLTHRKSLGIKDSNYYEVIKEKALESIKLTTHIFLFSVIRITITIKILLTINMRFVIF